MGLMGCRKHSRDTREPQCSSLTSKATISLLLFFPSVQHPGQSMPQVSPADSVHNGGITYSNVINRASSNSRLPAVTWPSQMTLQAYPLIITKSSYAKQLSI